MAFQKIDSALAKYYKSVGRSDYFTDGQGKFLSYCTENGFEEEDIDEEFANEPSDCLYVEFDEEFPLKPAIDDAEAKAAEIFRIIKHCYDNGKPPSASSKKKSLNVLDFVITTDKSTQRECDKIYKKQCSAIYKEEQSLRNCFAVGLKNNGYPFLINLVDSFVRDKADYFRSHNKDIPLVKWRNKSQYFQKISKEKKKMADTLVSGVETFIRRGFPVWQFGSKQFVKIIDDVKLLSLYVLMSYNFVDGLLKEQHENLTPFQFDCIIAVNKTKSIVLTQSGDYSGGDSTDDDDNEVEDDEKDIDHVGDIEEKLNSNKCPYSKCDIDVNLKDTAKVTRFVNKMYGNYKEKLKHTNHYKKHKNELQSYPLKKRFCSFIDRRQKGKDKLIFFQPPSNCNTIPQNHVPEWYYNALKTCIIPPSKSSNDLTAIRADTAAKGQILTISYHIEAIDKIRVYFFWNGKYTRVYPQDIPILLTEIVDMDYGKNNEWSKNEKKATFSKMKFVDTDFEEFYSQVTSQKHLEFPKQYK